MSGIIRRRDSLDKDILNLNMKIKDVAMAHDCFFVDSNQCLDSKHCLLQDGLHLNRYGVNTLANVLIDPFNTKTHSKNW